MATVNDQPIYMAQLQDILLHGFGLPIAQQLIANEMVRQEAQKKHVAASRAEIDQENDRILIDMFGPTVDPEQRYKLLDQLLATKGISRSQWQLTVERNAVLRKLADLQITVTDDEIRQQFAEDYGRKVVVRLIQCPSASAAQDILDKLKNNEDFAELARKFSTNSRSAPDGGLLPPIGAVASGLPIPIREAALAMTAVGEISKPIVVETNVHILKLEKIIPAQNVKFDDVKTQLAVNVHNNLNKALREQILTELFRAARIEYLDPVLQTLNAEATK
jgi:foldase protein PrsA